MTMEKKTKRDKNGYPEVFWVPDPQEIRKGVLGYGGPDRCHCALGWVNVSFHGEGFTLNSGGEAYEHVLRVLLEECRNLSRWERVFDSNDQGIIFHNDDLLTPSQVSQALARTAERLGYTEEA